MVSVFHHKKVVRCFVWMCCLELKRGKYMYYGSLEAGGTKMICAVCEENGKIIEQVSIPIFLIIP